MLSLVEVFTLQAAACAEMGSPMYAELLTRCASDLEAGGPMSEVLSGQTEQEVPPTAALALRLLGSVHRLVLERRAGALAAYYPSVGGSWSVAGGWPAFRQLLSDAPELVREWLDRPPQTNEVGRSVALYGGLLHLPTLGAGHLPVRLFEIGASGGLNLRADRFGYRDPDGRGYGDLGSEVVISDAWAGRRLEPWPAMRVVERGGCDVRPVDVATPEGRLLLTAYVWPDQQHRLERLRGALQVAARVPAVVEQRDAVSYLRGLTLVEGTTTVVWHSVMWQYLSPEDRAAATGAIEELGAQADDRRRFVHLRSEPTLEVPMSESRFLVQLRCWPDGAERLLGETVGHGVPTTWLA